MGMGGNFLGMSGAYATHADDAKMPLFIHELIGQKCKTF
jgi:hypothetical protein